MAEFGILGWLTGWVHPDAPSGGSGPGGSYVPNSWQHTSAGPAVGSPASRTALASSGHSTKNIEHHTVLDTIQAKSWEELKWVAMKVLGPESHQLGICYGVAEGLVGMVRGLLDLLKLVVLEAFYEELHRPYAWTVTPVMYLEAKAADRFLHPQIEKAHKQVVGLLAEARKVAMEPGKFFPEFWSKQKAEYKRKWERYKWLAQHPSVVNEFQAGRMEGQILLEVLMLVATVVDGVGLALKGLKALGEIPELLGLVEEVGGLKELETVVKVDRVVEGAEGAAGAETAPVATEAKTAPEAQTGGEANLGAVHCEEGYLW